MENPLHIFLLIGQSNMAGRGKLDQVQAIHCPEIHMFREGEWGVAEEPLHTDKPRIAGIGLGMSFAVDIFQKSSLSPLGLVPCAVGGTPLSRWMPGADLYEEAVATCKAALKDGSLAGILWHQGEGDSGDKDDAESYGDRLYKMLTTLRTELGAQSAPVITGELGPFLKDHEATPHYETVNAGLRGLETRLPRYRCAGAEGLTDNHDNLHFNAASLREFGRRYATCFLEIDQS